MLERASWSGPELFSIPTYAIQLLSLTQSKIKEMRDRMTVGLIIQVGGPVYIETGNLGKYTTDNHKPTSFRNNTEIHKHRK